MSFLHSHILLSGGIVGTFVGNLLVNHVSSDLLKKFFQYTSLLLQFVCFYCDELLSLGMLGCTGQLHWHWCRFRLYPVGYFLRLFSAGCTGCFSTHYLSHLCTGCLALLQKEADKSLSCPVDSSLCSYRGDSGKSAVRVLPVSWLRKAFSVLLVCCVINWRLEHLDPRLFLQRSA